MFTRWILGKKAARALRDLRDDEDTEEAEPTIDDLLADLDVKTKRTQTLTMRLMGEDGEQTDPALRLVVNES